MILTPPPPLPKGMGVFDPISAISVVGGLVSSFIGKKREDKLQKKQLALEAKALKEQQAENARRFAQEQAEQLIAPYERKRREQLILMGGVIGVAVVISTIFILSAKPTKKDAIK